MAGPAQSLSILLLIAAVWLGGLGTLGVRNRDRPGARGFSIFLFAAAAWTVVLSINIWPAQFLPVHAAMTLRNGLILLMLLGWLLLVLEYTRRKRVTPRPGPVALVAIVPVLTVLVTATNPLHHLAIGAGTPDTVGGGPAIEWGPWHLVFMAYAFVVSFGPAGLLVRDLKSAHGAHRNQLLLLLVGFAVGFLGLNDYLVTGAIASVPSYVRVSPFVLVLATSFWAVAIFRHQLFGIVPVSRQTVVETMPDPVIVVDDSDTVVDVNPAAKRLFDAPGAVTGTDLATFADTCPTISEYNDESVGDVDVTIDHDGTTRHFSMKTEPVRDTAAGSVVVLRDVTELKSYEHRLETQRDDLELLNQVIRHDVRNDLQLVLAHTEMAEQKVGDGDVTRHLETVLENTDHAIDLTKTARELTDVMLSPDEPTERVALRNRLESQIAAVRSAYPGAEIAIDGSIPAVSVQADEMIDSVFRNLLQNAVQHNDQAVPEIEVSAREQAKAVAIRIADNGPGIPDEDKETIFGRGEKGLDSAGTGVGLYLVRMLVDQYGGDVWVEDADPEGAAFVVELPLAS